MVGSSILPVTIHKNKLYFLFGKETTQDQSPGWSDFGGGMEPGENPLETALREGGEELTGFLGDSYQIKAHIRSHGNKIYHIEHCFPKENNRYHIHMIYYPYDENLPKYYNQNHNFLWKRMKPSILHKTKLFEKIEIRWFSVKELGEQKSKFRKFYQEIVENILSQTKAIRKFFSKIHTYKKRTKHHRRTKRI